MLRPFPPAPWEPLAHPFRGRSLGVLLWAFLFAPLKDHHLPGLLRGRGALPRCPGSHWPLLQNTLGSLRPGADSSRPVPHSPWLHSKSLRGFHPRLLLGQVQGHAVPQTRGPSSHQPGAWGTEGPQTGSLGAGTYVSSLYSDFKAAAWLVTCDAWRAGSCWPARLHASEEPGSSPCFPRRSPWNHAHAFLLSQRFSLGE